MAACYLHWSLLASWGRAAGVDRSQWLPFLCVISAEAGRFQGGGLLAGTVHHPCQSREVPGGRSCWSTIPTSSSRAPEGKGGEEEDVTVMSCRSLPGCHPSGKKFLVTGLSVALQTLSITGLLESMPRINFRTWLLIWELKYSFSSWTPWQTGLPISAQRLPLCLETFLSSVHVQRAMEGFQVWEAWYQALRLL